MKVQRQSFEIATRGRGTTELTARVQEAVTTSGVADGLCTVFLHHTSASLILCENADATVRRDLEAFFARLVPDGDPLFEHTEEGDDDMPGHVRAILTQNSLTLPVVKGRCDLGTYQGVFLWEHRHAPHRRRVTTMVIGA